MHNNERTLKVGIIGCGNMGQHHIRSVKFQRSAELIAVADPLPDKQKLGSILPERTKIYSDSSELIEKETLDILHIVTPPSTHASLTKEALTHGMNVYVEKPFALQEVEAESIVSLANKNGLKICAGHQALFESATTKIQENLREIGDIVHMESYFSFKSARRNFSTVDQLIDILPHPVYLLIHFLSLSFKENKKTSVHLKSLDVKSDGEVRALIQMHEQTGVLVVTLKGRPVEPYVRIVGTNGSLQGDYIHGAIIKLAGPGSSGVSVVLNPYIRSAQLFAGTTKGLISRALRKQKSYTGLAELIDAFYTSVRNGGSTPIPSSSIIKTVKICEAIGDKLKEAEIASEKLGKKKLKQLEEKLSRVDSEKERVLITGGSGFLGKEVAYMLRQHGWPVRVLARGLPPAAAQVPGVEYFVADLVDSLPEEAIRDTGTVVHCAAETAGGKEKHKRNTIDSTQNIIEAAGKSGVKQFIHISSIAVIKTSRDMGSALDEDAPLDIENENRGTYVWAKAEAERLAVALCKVHNIDLRIIRPGPLVNFNAFQAPGRLGRELGPIYVAVGGKRSKLSVCSVHTASEVICYYVNDFNSAPPVLNLIESKIPTRKDLILCLKQTRPDLRVLCIPLLLLRILSLPLKVLQKIIASEKKPIDLYDVFASEKYNNDLAVKTIRKAKEFNTIGKS